MAVRVDDARSKEQKLQSDAATVQQGKTANAMEKTRLRAEAQAVAQRTPAKSPKKSTAKVQSKVGIDTAGPLKKRKGKKKESEFFTAKEANPNKKK